LTSKLRPFSPGEVSLGLYVHPDDRDLRILRRQALLAIDAGFAGVSLAEHHNDRVGYVPNPLLAVATLLPSMPTGWVAAAPTILGLRPVRTLAEDVLWVNALFPGRVGMAVGAGFDLEDFDIVGKAFAGRLHRFRDELAELGSSRLDHAPFPVNAISAVPILVATRGLRNAVAAAHNRFGILLPPLPRATARVVAEAYRQGGGAEPVAIGRWVWLGDPPLDAVAAFNGAIASTRGDLSWRNDDSVISVDAAASPAELANFLIAQVTESGASHLHIRIHLPGLEPNRVEEQIERIGCHVLPVVRAGIAAVAGTSNSAELR
jgi:alkanesulfonate monooxygenase SsuD/methylene tetrahydromethanopterin reductase-like flavin-dependent oxidoreductase (luciferase family)